MKRSMRRTTARPRRLLAGCRRTTGARSPGTRQMASVLSPPDDRCAHSAFAAGRSCRQMFALRSPSREEDNVLILHLVGPVEFGKMPGEPCFQKGDESLETGVRLSVEIAQMTFDESGMLLCGGLALGGGNAECVRGLVPKEIGRNARRALDRLRDKHLALRPPFVSSLRRSIGSDAGEPSSFSEIRKPIFSDENPKGGASGSRPYASASEARMLIGASHATTDAEPSSRRYEARLGRTATAGRPRCGRCRTA